jgi:hypothetical protein
MEAKFKFTVDRKRWLRGEGSMKSRLLRKSDRKMCCLGFRALAKGATEEQILDRESPRDLTIDDKTGALADLCELDERGRPVDNNKVAQNLMGTNDHRLDSLDDDADEVDMGDPHSEEQREQQIRDLFASIGEEVEFVG